MYERGLQVHKYTTYVSHIGIISISSTYVVVIGMRRLPSIILSIQLGFSYTALDLHGSCILQILWSQGFHIILMMSAEFGSILTDYVYMRMDVHINC